MRRSRRLPGDSASWRRLGELPYPYTNRARGRGNVKGAPLSDERVDVEPAAIVLGALMEIRNIKPDDWTDGPVFDLAYRLDRVEGLITTLQEIASWLELVLSESMIEDDLPIPGIGYLHRQEKQRSTWRYPGASDEMRQNLAEAVASDVARDVATGEIDPMKRNVALAALRAAYEAIPSFSSIKVPGRIRFHVDLEDYRTAETYYTVKIERAE